MLRKLIEGLRGLRRGGDDQDWQFNECRELVRLRCRYEVEYRAENASHRGQVVDMGLGGMKLRCFQAPALDDVIEVALSSGEQHGSSVPCRVRWMRTRESDRVQFVGLTYDTSDEVLGRSWVRVILRELGFRPDKIFQRRKYVRAECFVPVHVVYEGGLKVHGKLYNLGIQGALVEAEMPLLPGNPFKLNVGPFEELPMLALDGTVAQQAEQDQMNLVGVRFEELGDQAIDSLGRYLRHLLLNHWET